MGVESSSSKIPDTWASNTLAEGLKLGEPRPLFSMVPAVKLEKWREAYSGRAIQEQKRLEAEKAAAKKAAKLAKKTKKEKGRKQLMKKALVLFKLIKIPLTV